MLTNHIKHINNLAVQLFIQLFHFSEQQLLSTLFPLLFYS